jgi:hypothetical protein
MCREERSDRKLAKETRLEIDENLTSHHTPANLAHTRHVFDSRTDGPDV